MLLDIFLKPAVYFLDLYLPVTNLRYFSVTSNLCTNTRRMWVVLCTRQSSALGSRFPHFVFPRLSLASPAFEPPSPFCFTAVLNFCGSGAKRCKIRVLPHSARQTLRAFHFLFLLNSYYGKSCRWAKDASSFLAILAGIILDYALSSSSSYFVFVLYRFFFQFLFRSPSF